MSVAAFTLLALCAVHGLSGEWTTVAVSAESDHGVGVTAFRGPGRVSGTMNSHISEKLFAVIAAASTGSLTNSPTETESVTATPMSASLTASPSKSPLPFCVFYGHENRIYDLNSLTLASGFYTATGFKSDISAADTLNFNICGPSNDPACPSSDTAVCLHRDGGGAGVYDVGDVSLMSFDTGYNGFPASDSSSVMNPNQLAMGGPQCGSSGGGSATAINMICNPDASPPFISHIEYLGDAICGFTINMHSPAGCAVGETSTASYSESLTASSSITESATATPTHMTVDIRLGISVGSQVLVAGESSTMVFTLSSTATFDVVVHLELDGTAVVGTDYTITTHRLTIPAGQLSGSVTIMSTTTQAATHLTIYIGTTTVPLVTNTPTSYGYSLFGLVPSKSATPTPTRTTSPTESATETPTPSTTKSATPSITRSRSFTATTSRTSTHSVTNSHTATASASRTNTPTSGVTVSVSVNSTSVASGTVAVTCTLVSALLTFDLQVPYSQGGTAGILRGTDYLTVPPTGGYITIPAGQTTGVLLVRPVAGPPPNCNGVQAGSCNLRITILLPVPSHIQTLLGNTDPLLNLA